LTARLDAADGLVIVVGGAGAGKTTLLDAWVAARGGALVELGADGERARVRDVVRDARAGVVVLDGVEALPGAELRELRERIPAGVRLVLASRTPVSLDPGARPVGLWLGEADLAFAEDETYQVLAALFGDAEAADALAPDLHLLTHGWPALVGLAGAWLAGQPAEDRRGRLIALARAEGALEEYLVPAVLAGFTADELELVRRLTRLPGIDAALADRLDLTEDLVAVPPFVQGLARRAGWFAVPHGWKATLQRELPMSPEAEAGLRAAGQAGM
jgi:ATP/maltotriose-dependent transcriptional regulator MalT